MDADAICFTLGGGSSLPSVRPSVLRPSSSKPSYTHHIQINGRHVMLDHLCSLHSPFRIPRTHLENDALLLSCDCLENKASKLRYPLALAAAAAAFGDKIDGAQGRVLFPNALHEFPIDDFFAVYDIAPILEGEQA